MKNYFVDAENQNWFEITERSRAYNFCPASIYIPLSLPFSRDLMFLTPGFSAETAMLYWGEKCARQSETVRKNKLNFFIGPVPFIPDFRQTKLSRPDSKVPLFHSDFWLDDCLYELETFMPPEPELDKQFCYLKMTARNYGKTPCDANLYLKVANIRENELVPHDYIPFRMDNELVPLMDNSSASPGGDLTVTYLDGRQVLKICSYEGFKLEHLKRFDLPEDEPYPDVTPRCALANQFFEVRTEYRIYHARNLLKLSATLSAGEERSVIVAFAASKNDLYSIDLPDYDQARNACIEYYHRFFEALPTRFDFGSEWKNRMADVFLATDLQFCLLEGKNREFYRLCQGHSNRWDIWITEGMAHLKGFCQFGAFREARKILELFMSFQDGPTRPEGMFSTTDGAICNPGPRWVNTTGSVLSCVANYLILSNDLDFWEKYKGQLKRAALWILNEVEISSRDTSKPWSGIMPPGRANDEDINVVAPSVSDSFLLAGLLDLLALPSMKQEPEYADWKKRTQAYHDAIQRICFNMQTPEGFIPRFVEWNDEKEDDGKIKFWKFESTANCLSMLNHDVLDSQDEHTHRLVEFYERNYFCDFLIGRMDDDNYYLGWNEFPIQQYYWKNRQWKKAWGMMNSLMNYCISQDLCLTRERITLSNSAFVPFQPNDSCNGRFLDALVNGLVYTYEDAEQRPVLLFLGGESPLEFARNAVRKAECNTRLGKMKMTVSADGLFKAEFEDALEQETLLTFPEHFSFESSSTLTVLRQNFWKLPPGTTVIEGTLSIASFK